MCSCKTEVETVHHFLFYCPLWIRFRSSIRDIGYKHNRWGDTSFFVGGWSGPSKDGEEQAWKPNKEAVWTTINYAISTGRLDNRQDGAAEERTQRSDESGGGQSQTPTKKIRHYLHSPYYVPHPTLTLHIYRQSRRYIGSWQPETHPRILMCHSQRKGSWGFYFFLFFFSQGSHFFLSTTLLKETSESEQLE